MVKTVRSRKNEYAKYRTYHRERYLRQKAERQANVAPDPIEGLSTEVLAYIAGLIDGEGSIYIAAVGPHRRKTCYPNIVVAMTHRGVIDWLAETLGKSTVKLNNHTRVSRNPERWKPQWKYQLFGKRAQLLCKRLLPYLKVKIEQAKIICEFPCDLRIAPGARINDTTNQLRYELRDRIRELNKRGPS